MKQMLLIATCVVMIVVLVHVSQVSCLGLRRRDTAPDNEQDNLSDSQESKRNEEILNTRWDLRDKRSCPTYLCSHTHMASHAGNITLQAALRNQLQTPSPRDQANADLRAQIFAASEHSAWAADLARYIIETSTLEQLAADLYRYVQAAGLLDQLRACASNPDCDPNGMIPPAPQ